MRNASKQHRRFIGEIKIKYKLSRGWARRPPTLKFRAARKTRIDRPTSLLTQAFEMSDCPICRLLSGETSWSIFSCGGENRPTGLKASRSTSSIFERLSRGRDDARVNT